MGYAPAGRAPLSPSYRPRPAGRSEPGMRWAMLGAAGLGGLLLLGMGGWAMMGRRPAAVPVIEADSRPLRVKPDNPGGMQIAAADELGDGVRGSERMAPAAELPAPQALRAQMGQTAPAANVPPTPSPASAPTPALAVETAAPVPLPSSVSPLPDTPSKPAALVASARPPAMPPATTAKAAPPQAAATASGSTLVQLAALGSEAAAMAEWQRLGKMLPDVFGDRRPTLQKAERDGKAFWRLRTTGFTDVADATAFCAKLRAKGASCTIASF